MPENLFLRIRVEGLTRAAGRATPNRFLLFFCVEPPFRLLPRTLFFRTYSALLARHLSFHVTPHGSLCLTHPYETP